METKDKSKEQLIKENNQLRARIDKLQKSEIETQKIKNLLKESEEKFRILYNNSPDMYVSVSPEDATILFCNDTLLKRTGYSRKEIIGSPIFSMYHEDCMDEVHEAFQQFVNSGVVKNKELILKRKDGSKFDVILNVDAVVDEDGKIIHSISSWRDISERKQAEEKLHKSESLFRNIYQSELIGIALSDTNYNIISANSYFCKMLGYTEDELKSKTFIDISHPDDAIASKLAVQKANQQKKYFTRVEKRYIKKNGQFIYCQTTVSQIPAEDGDGVYNLAIIEDITERKQAVEALLKKTKEYQLLAKLLDNSSQPFAVGYTDGTLSKVNTAFCELTGYTEDELLNNVSWNKTLTPEKWRKYEEELLTKLIINGNSQLFEKEYIRKDGEIISVELLMHSSLDDNNNLEYVYGFITDITQRKQAEIELQESELRFKALHNASFGGIAIHDKGLILECNQGLADISGYTVEELIGMDGLLLIEEKSRKNVLENILSGYEKPYEVIGQRKNGEQFPLRLEARQIPYKGKEVRVVEFRDITESKQAEIALQSSELHYRTLFNESPIPLWEEDFSEVKKYIDKLKKNKIVDFRKYFDDNSEELREIAGLIKIIDINNATLQLYEANSKEELIIGLESVFTEDSYIAFKQEMIAIAQGKTKYNFESVVKTLKGKIRHIHLEWSVLPGYENSLERVFISTVDITDSKQAELKLRQSEAILKETGQMAKVGGWEVDAQTFEVIWTEEIYNIHEVPLDAMPPLKETINFFHPDDRPKLETAIHKALDNGDPYDLEIRFITAKGKHLWTHTACKPVIVDGKTVKLIGTLQDITERKMLEKELKDSEEKFRTLITNTEEIVYIIAKDGTFILSEGKGLNKLGLNPGQVVGQSVFELYKDFPDMLDDMRRTFDGETITVEAEIGDNYFRSWYTPHKNHTGEIIGLLGLSVNISEQKKMEEKILEEKNKAQQYLNIADIMMVSVDSSGIVKLINPKGCEILGYPEDEIVGHNWFDNFLPERLRENVKAVSKKVFAGEMESIDYYENEILTKSGDERLIAWHNAVYKDEMGNIIGTLSSGEDITERKLAEEALSENEKKYRSLFDNINVGSALHEIVLDENNNPIDFIWLDVNPAYEKLTQLKRSDIIGKRGLEILPNLEKRWIDIYGKVALTAKSENLMDYSEYLNKYWEVKAYSPKMNQFAVALTDITERKLADEELVKHREHLEQLVIERTAEVDEKNKKLSDQIKVFVGRELKIRNLEKKIRLMEEK